MHNHSALQVEIAQPLSKLCAQFPDLYIGKSIVFPAARPTFSLLPVIITLPVFLDMKEAIAGREKALL